MPPRAKESTPAAPSATGNAGSHFESKVGAFYLVALLSGGEPRGLPGASVRQAGFQQRSSDRPLDDVVVYATNADGSNAVLEIQVKRTLSFTSSDKEFKDVVVQMWKAAQKPEFKTSRYELAAAVARSSTRIEQSCQEVLHWARQLPDGAAFAAHIAREHFSSKGMRDFVEVFRENLGEAGAPNDDETVWQLLRRFQILVFDFESPGSDYEHRARERLRLALTPNQAQRAAEVWPILIDRAAECARSGGMHERRTIVEPLTQTHGLLFKTRADLAPVNARLAEAAEHALADIKDDVGGVRLARTELVDRATVELEQNRILHIVGSAGVGKSWVMKTLAQRLVPEGRIIVLRNGRIVGGGWAQMAQTLNCPVSKDELFNELGCGGGAILFIDNIDQIVEPTECSTVNDLLSAVVKSPGWRAVVTGARDNIEWKIGLPSSVRAVGFASLEVAPISDEEAEVLSEGNGALALLLAGTHPAHTIARNLFYLSRMIDLGAGKADAAAGLATEADLANLWWRYGGGRSEDDGRLARLKVLRTMGTQVHASPGRVAFKADDFDSAAVTQLLRLESLREDTKGMTVAFRHDVLRDWTIGFVFHDDPELIAQVPKDKPLPPGLARGLEVAARLALDADATGERWSKLLAVVEASTSHGSWMRPVLLTLPRSENASALFRNLGSLLLADDGKRLSDLIRLMIAVKSVPIAKLAALLQPSMAVPIGASDLVIPKGLGWARLVVWLLRIVDLLPTARIPDVAKVFQAWLISTQHQSVSFNALVVQFLFSWLALIEDNMSYRIIRRFQDAPPNLKIPHLKEVRDEIRMTAFLFAHFNPAAAEQYLDGLEPDEVRPHEAQAIVQASESLARAAPKAMATFTLGALIEKADDDDRYGRRRDLYGPFGAFNAILSPASPSQGPFLAVLKAASAEGLRLVRGIVEHATQWRRDLYAEERQMFPRLSIPFPNGAKSFEGDWAVFHWARSAAPSVITTSALMALEAWGHQQIEGGRPFDDVLHDVLGPDGSSIAFVAVAIDLVLSHWDKASDVGWPLVSTPELLTWDDARSVRDQTGVDRIASYEQEPASWTVKRAELDARPSRRARLSYTIGHYAIHADPKLRDAVRAALEQARNEIMQRPAPEGEDLIHGLRATAERAIRMTYSENWPLVTVTLADGRQVKVHQYERDPAEAERFAAGAARADANSKHMNIRLQVQTALLDPAKSSADILRDGIAWAKALAGSAPTPASDERDEDEDFNETWDRRAAAMTAGLAVRDYSGDDRADVVAWATPILEAAAAEPAKFEGNQQVEYCMPAIGALGLVELYRRTQNLDVRDWLLTLAGHRHPAVVNALGNNLVELAKIDPRLRPALIRIVMASAARPHRRDSERQTQRRDALHRKKVEDAIDGERQWLNDARAEPEWPELPSWPSRPRRGIRIGGGLDEDDELPEKPDYYVDEHLLAAVVSHLVRMTIGEVPKWLADLAAHLMAWTDQANGPHDKEARERDNRPHTWNGHFFEFAGILSVALPHDCVMDLFVGPMTKFKDEPFHDAAAIYLRGFDRAVRATDTKKPENAVAVRTALANRIRAGRNYRRYEHEKTFNSETHAGDAMTALFFQPSRWIASSGASIPKDWDGLVAHMPTLTELVVNAPTSGYLAVLFLNVVETSKNSALLPFVTKALVAWCGAYGADTNYWTEHNIGSRVCAWLAATMTEGLFSATEVTDSLEALTKCLDVLVRTGIAQARGVEEQIGDLTESR